MYSKKLIYTLVSGLSFVTGLQADAILTFEEMDSNANGYISSDEAKASHDIDSNFEQIDINADGNINITEFQKYMGKGRATPPEEMETPEPGAAPY